PSRLAGVRVTCLCAGATTAEALDAMLAGTDFRHLVVNGQILIEHEAPEAAVPPARAMPPLGWLDPPIVSRSSSSTMLGGGAPAARVGTITGRVYESASQRPLAGAQVFVGAAGLGVLSNADGRYILINVPDGAVTVTVQMIGFQSAEQT